MGNYSQTVTDAIQDIRRTLEERRQAHGQLGQTNKTAPAQAEHVENLLSEIDRLRTLLKVISVRYYQLAQNAIPDPFSKEYEEVLAQLASVKKTLMASEERVKAYRKL